MTVAATTLRNPDATPVAASAGAPGLSGLRPCTPNAIASRTTPSPAAASVRANGPKNPYCAASTSRNAMPMSVMPAPTTASSRATNWGRSHTGGRGGEKRGDAAGPVPAGPGRAGSGALGTGTVETGWSGTSAVVPGRGAP